MKLKKQCILIFSGLLLTPLFVSFTTSCRHQTESITIDSSSGEQLYKGVTLTYTFKNVTASDHITIESDYDDALPTHKSYIHIEVNNLSATITRTDKSLASGDSQECVLKFCNNNDLFDQRTILLLDDQWQSSTEYINDRTFSIGYNVDLQHWTRGTAWILNRIPPNDSNDQYHYWLVTNFHVIADYPIIPLYKQIANPRYYTGENTIGSPAPSDSYTSFASFDILDPSTYYRYSTSQTVVDSKTDIEGYPSNDIAIINCNFGTNPPASAKSKLDVLNNYWASYSEGERHINDFIDWKNYYPLANTTFTYAGYPAKNNAEDYLNLDKYAEWQSSEMLEFSKYAGGDASKSVWHGTASAKFQNSVDVAPQLIENKNNYYDNMGGGASGSMIIENTSHKIAGIYWGGFGNWDSDLGPLAFYPFFDIFNDSNFSYLGKTDTFLSPYMQD